MDGSSKQTCECEGYLLSSCVKITHCHNAILYYMKLNKHSIGDDSRWLCLGSSLLSTVTCSWRGSVLYRIPAVYLVTWPWPPLGGLLYICGGFNVAHLAVFSVLYSVCYLDDGHGRSMGTLHHWPLARGSTSSPVDLRNTHLGSTAISCIRPHHCYTYIHLCSQLIATKSDL